MNNSSKTGLRHENARTKEQQELMTKIERDGVCPFCKEYFTKYHPKPILKETDYWFVTTNMSPYEGTRHHFFLVYKPAHIIYPKDMVSEARIELFDHIQSLTDEYKVPGGSIFMRFGDMRYNGSSVEHLHVQFIVGEMEDKDTEALRVKLGWKLK